MYFQNTDFIFYDPNPFCAHFRRLHISLKIRVKRVESIKNKMCIFTIRETFVFSSICQKYQGTQIKAFLCFELKGGWKREGDYDHKTAFIWVPWHFLHMLNKTKVSRLVKTHILCFKTLLLLACYLRDTISISFKMHKKGRGQKKIKCVFLPYEKLSFYKAYAKIVRVPSNPPPLH